jgi:hypothetical protein
MLSFGGNAERFGHDCSAVWGGMILTVADMNRLSRLPVSMGGFQTLNHLPCPLRILFVASPGHIALIALSILAVHCS